MNTPSIYLIRHGETVWNVERRWQGGRDDSPLTERGRDQARNCANVLRDLLERRQPHFVSSPLGRARTTMEIILQTLALPPDCYSTDARLAEMDLGEWSGQRAEDVAVKDRARFEAREGDKWNVQIPGGESYAMVSARAREWLAEVVVETVAVSHGGFGRILRGHYAGLTWQEISALDEPYGCIFRLQEGVITKFAV